MTKAEARTAAKAVRAAFVGALAPDAIANAASAAAIVAHEHLGEATCVAVYQAIGTELPTEPLIELLAAQGRTLALPHVTTRTAPMRFLRWTVGDPLLEGPFGLRQPAAAAPEVQPDLVFVPLLAFDAALNRLGYGAGHYDRALAHLPATRRIGFAWSVQRVAALPVEPWDMPLHGVATEQGWVTN